MHEQGKRERLARLAATLRLTSALEAMPRRAIVMGLTYHRIGDSEACEHDSGVYSATTDGFDAHLAHLKKSYDVLAPEEAVRIATGQTRPRSGVVITFDDGYIDNYETAFPVLKKHGLSAMFFLTTSCVGTGFVPWWDRIAYIVKHTRHRVIRLSYPRPVEFDLDQMGVRMACLRVLRLYRDAATTDPDRFECELSRACEQSCETYAPTQRFLSWDQAREMQRAGMAFGSHTHTHQILSKLTPEEQRFEVETSRDIMQRELQTPIEVLAYPVGSRHTFSAVTIDALKSAGYRAAFSHYGGGNRAGEFNPFDIRRESVNPTTHQRFRLQTAIGAATGSLWF